MKHKGLPHAKYSLPFQNGVKLKDNNTLRKSNGNHNYIMKLFKMYVTLILYVFIYTVHILIIKQNILYMYIHIGLGYKNLYPF